MYELKNFWYNATLNGEDIDFHKFEMVQMQPAVPLDQVKNALVRETTATFARAPAPIHVLCDCRSTAPRSR